MSDPPQLTKGFLAEITFLLAGYRADRVDRKSRRRAGKRDILDASHSVSRRVESADVAARAEVNPARDGPESN